MVHILRAIMLLMVLMPGYHTEAYLWTIITIISFINTLLSADAYHIHGAYVPRDGTPICILMIRDTAHHISPYYYMPSSTVHRREEAAYRVAYRIITADGICIVMPFI